MMSVVRKVFHKEGCEKDGTHTSVEFELEYDNSRIVAKRIEAKGINCDRKKKKNKRVVESIRLLQHIPIVVTNRRKRLEAKHIDATSLESRIPVESLRESEYYRRILPGGLCYGIGIGSV